MTLPRQAPSPTVRLIEDDDGEVTLYLDDGQAMQAWEAPLMEASADMMCEFGSEFLEAGLGLGISALRVASNARTIRHVVVERHAEVIRLFGERHEHPPATLAIVHGDFFEVIRETQPESVDGIFFDPYLGASDVWQDPELWAAFVPLMLRALRPGGALMPCFTEQPVLRAEFLPFFERVIVERRPFTTYANTTYTTQRTGDGFIQCFVKR